MRRGRVLAAMLRLWADRAGAAAVEFALIVPVLVLITLSTFEAGWYMVQTIMLDRAVDRTVRELRVGSFANPTQTSMRQRICQEAMVLIDCTENLTVELVPVTTPASYPQDRARCIHRASPIKPVLRFVPGGRSQTMFVRACYVVSPFTPGMALGLAMAKDENGDFRLISKSAFMNEPM
jgi:Flp pilus assembly pilin Flp